MSLVRQGGRRYRFTGDLAWFFFSFSSLDEIRTCSMSYDLVRLLSVIVRGGENEEMHTTTWHDSRVGQKNSIHFLNIR